MTNHDFKRVIVKQQRNLLNFSGYWKVQRIVNIYIKKLKIQGIAIQTMQAIPRFELPFLWHPKSPCHVPRK